MSATNILSVWRRALMALIDEKLQGGDFEVRAGERDGASKDRKLAVVFAQPLSEWSPDVNFVQPVMLVRAWIPKPSMPKASSPPDPEPVEQLMLDILELLDESVQTTLVEDFYFRVQLVEPDYDDWGVQATLVGFYRNPAIA